MRPILILLRGNSGSGKSTAARAIQRRMGRGTLLLSQDGIRREMLYAADGPDTLAIPLLNCLLEYGAAHCSVVILEGILRADWYAPVFRTAQRLFGERISAWYFDLPFEETLLRHQTKPNRADFGEAEMRQWWNEQDFIGFLPERTLTKEMSLAQIVERICRDAAALCEEKEV